MDTKEIRLCCAYIFTEAWLHHNILDQAVFWANRAQN